MYLKIRTINMAFYHNYFISRNFCCTKTLHFVKEKSNMQASFRKSSQFKSFGWIVVMMLAALSPSSAFPLTTVRKVHPWSTLYSYDPEQEAKLDVTFNRALEEKFQTTKDEDEKMRLLQEHYDSMIPVRFINYDQIGGSTKLAYAVPGTNLLKIADVSEDECQ